MEKKLIYPQETQHTGCLSAATMMVALLLAILVAAMMSGCRSIRYVPVETVRHDSIFLTKWQKDSLYIHDSIYQKEKGDTILIEKWHTKYIEKQVHDTTYVSKIDSIQVPYPVEASLSKWQKRFISIGKIATGIGIALLLAGILWMILKVYRIKP